MNGTSGAKRGKRFGCAGLRLQGRGYFRSLLMSLVLFAPSSSGKAETEGESMASRRPWSIQGIASFAHYAIHQSAPFFGTDDRSWMETSVTFGGRLEWQGRLALEIVGLGLKTTGRDAFGSGSAPAGAPPGTPEQNLDPQFEFDTLFLQWRERSGMLPFTITLGRQPITLGSQFLIGDGVYDGFHPDFPQAVWHNPRSSFDAGRLELEVAGSRLDLFGYRVHPTWDGGGDANGFVVGGELSRTFESIRGSYAAGLFYRESPSDQDNDMWVPNVRFEQRWPGLEDLFVSGEWAGEFGTGRNPFYVTTPGQDLAEHAWHAEVDYTASQLLGKPFVELGYVHYSRDFTPFATGFSDWGKWYLGNQIDWILFGSNSRIVRAQVGLWLYETVKLRMLYHNTRLVSGASGTLSDEFTWVAEWYSKSWWANLAVGYSVPGDALARSGLSNPFGFLNADAVPIGNRSRAEVIAAVGYKFRSPERIFD